MDLRGIEFLNVWIQRRDSRHIGGELRGNASGVRRGAIAETVRFQSESNLS